MATTAFVNNQITAFGTANLGTMAGQNANNVSITGGGVTGITNLGFNDGWTVTPVGSTLYFSFNGNNLATLDSAGNFTAKGNVTAFGIV